MDFSRFCVSFSIRICVSFLHHCNRSFLKDFLVWTIFKVFIEFVTTLLLFYILVFWPQDMWDLSFPIKDRTHTLCIGRRSLNHWTAREVSQISLFVCLFFVFLATPGGLWDLSFPTRDRTHNSCSGSLRVLTTESGHWG